MSASTNLVVKRPETLYAHRRGPVADVEFIFDGKVLTVRGKGLNVYAQFESPGTIEDAVSDVQLHRYNAATLELMQKSMVRWAQELSTLERPVTPYFVRIGFRDVEEPEMQRFFNRIPTSFSLNDEQVDKLIDAGRTLLRSNPDYQHFLADVGRNH